MKFLSPISGINVEHSTNAVLKVQSDSTNSSHLAKIQLSHLRPDGVNYSQSYLGMDTWSTYLSADEGLYLQTNGSTRLFVHGSGNVGIGTTNPASILDVNGGSANGLSVQAANVGTEYVLNAKTSNGTSRLWVGGTGAVGIGNTNPNYILDVGGTTRIAGTLHMYGSVRNYSGHFTLQNGAQDANILFKVNDGGTTTTPMMIDGDTSRVGIGTEGPTQKLHVAGGDINLDLGRNLRFSNQLAISKANNGELNFYAGTSSTNGGFNFRTWDGSNYIEDALVIRNNRNVGIGTSNPSDRLTIHNGGSTTRAFIYNSGGSGHEAKVEVYTADDGAGHSGGVGYLRSYGWGNAEVRVGGSYLRQSDGRMQLISSGQIAYFNTGNVGIGVYNPVAKLDVAGSVKTSGYFYGNELRANLDNGSRIVLHDGAGNMEFRTQGGTERMTIAYGGNVGIGTSNPLSKLDIVGNQRIVHSSSLAGLEVYTNSAVPLVPQVRIGRDSGQYYGIQVTDGDARLIHRQDEAGSGTHQVINEIWTSTSGGGNWTWRLRDNAGAFREDYMTLNSAELDVNAHGRFGAHLTLGTEIDQGFYMDASNGAYRANGTTGTRGFYFQGYNGSGTTMYVGLTGNYAGMVGIGTTQPSAKLQVNGAIAINDAYTKIQEGSNNSVRISTNSGYGDIGPQNSSYFHFGTDRGEFYFNKPTAFHGTVRPYVHNNYDLGSSTKQWNRIYGRYIYQNGTQVLSTRAEVHTRLYSTGGNANDYTQFGIYRNYGEGQPTGLGHNTLLNVMQESGSYGWQITSSTAAGGDSMWYRQKGADWGDDNWYQIASRSWVTSQGYGDATQAWVQAQGYITSETDSQTLSWNVGNGQLTISNGNTVDLDGRYMTPIYNGANDNSGKADFAVGTGGYGAVSLRSNQVQIGGDDMNYTGRFDATSTYVSIRGWDRDLLFLTNGSSSAANMQHIKFSTKPSNGGATERVRIDGTGYTYFHGLDLAISNVNSDHGKGNYFRGSNTHLVIGTGGTLHLNMSGSTTVMHGTNWYSGAGDRQTNLGASGNRFERIHAKQIGSYDAGIFFEDTDAYRCVRPNDMTTGSSNGLISLGYSNNRWATIYGNNLDVTSNVKVQGSVYTDNANYSIDLRDHGSHTWLRNAEGFWTFQAGTSGDDWTQTYSFHLPAAGGTENNVWAEIGQRTSNNTGRYKGLRIVKYENNSLVNGDLLTGHITVSANTNSAGAQIKFNDHVPNSTQNVFLTAYHADSLSHGGGASLHLTSTEPNVTMVSERYHSIQHGDSSQWAAAYSWGNHANAGYLTGSHTHSASDITSGTLNGARLPWSSGNDGFTGTYGIVWRAGDNPWTASWLTVNGQTDTLNTRNIDATGNITIDGVLKSYRSDTNTILKSYNKSATGSPAQFYIRHNYGNVDIANTRGKIYFETRADFETTVVAQTDLHVGNSIQHWNDGGTGMYFNTDQVDIRTQGVKRMISAGTDGRTYFGSNTNKGYLREFPSNTYGSQIGRIARITFTGGFSDWDNDYHSISSKDINGSMSDSLSINSYNNITVRLDSNNNNATSHFYITNNTMTGTGTMLLDMNTGTNETEIATAFIPYTDRLQTLGRDDRRWQIVFCETLDSAGQHESNLQDEEQPISQYATGTVLSWKDGKNRPCTQFADHMRMGIAVHGQDSPLIQGAEPVLCTGVVEEGDYLVTSRKEGHAEAMPRHMVVQQQLLDCVIGKALENGDGESHLIKTWINI